MNKEQNVDSKFDFSVLTPFYWEERREGVFGRRHVRASTSGYVFVSL